MNFADRPRDSQRSKVYAAEQAAFPEMFGDEMTVPEIQAWVDNLTAHVYVRRQYADWFAGYRDRHVQVRDGRGRRIGGGNPAGFITMPKRTRTKPYVLHEVAHVLAPTASAFHGWEFCAVYLDLVRHALGKEAHDRLRDEFRKWKVRYKRPQVRRSLNEAQKTVLRDRLAAGRAARQSVA